MKLTKSIKITQIGQSGLRLDINDDCYLVDPYLSNSVQELDCSSLERQTPIAFSPDSITNLAWVFITHEHMDHCDPHTIPALAATNPKARFMAPEPARRLIQEWGVEKSRIEPPPTETSILANGVSIRSLPGAHPKIILGTDGRPTAVGYLIKHEEITYYIAGDTSPCDKLIKILKNIGPIDIAFLPVNEDNYFRRKQGIIGNMSIREAFGLASECTIKTVIPVHWDLFEVNSTDPDEIKAVYSAYKWPFKLAMSIDEAMQ